MASSFRAYLAGDAAKSQDLTALCTVSQATSERFPDEHFDDIRKRLQEELLREEWARRPRTYFILFQLRRQDAMTAFVLQGLDDTSLPYQGRKDLPNVLNIEEANSFLHWQHLVYSDVLRLEKNGHVTIKNGDKLFEASCPKLGFGSSG